MADKNIQMTQRNAGNTAWDNIFPVTKAANVKTSGGSDVETQLTDLTKFVAYGIATGSANVYAVTLSPVPSTYIDGLALSVKINVQNTGASTINVNGLGAKSILKANGNALSSGNLKAGSIYTLRYNGTSFILQGEGGEYGTAIASEVLSGKTIGTENGIISGTMIDRNAGGHVLALGSSAGVYSTEQGDMNINAYLQPPVGYYNGNQWVKFPMPGLLASNIRNGVNIFGISGNLIEGKPYATGTFLAETATYSVSGLSFTPQALRIKVYSHKYWQFSSDNDYLLVENIEGEFVGRGTNQNTITKQIIHYLGTESNSYQGLSAKIWATTNGIGFSGLLPTQYASYMECTVTWEAYGA
jgi:hypothetical protein